MKISAIQRGLVLFAITAGVLGVGCELIVDFDRTKIPAEGADGSTVDATVPLPTNVEDAGSDAEAEDASVDATDASSEPDSGEPDGGEPDGGEPDAS